MKQLSTILLVACALHAGAQSTNASLNEDYYHWIDRYEVKAGRVAPELFTTLKPYKRSALVGLIDSLQAKDKVFSSPADLFNYEYLRNDNWEWSRSLANESRRPLFKHIYKKKSDFFFSDYPELDLHVSPVLLLMGGKDTDRDASLFTNTRGVELRGMIDRKIGFYSFMSENQAVLPQYVMDELARIQALPSEGFTKDFKKDGVDFFQARGYIDFNVTKSIYMQFGHDKLFVGNGSRSLIYSDYAPPQLYWRTNVKVRKLNYLFQINRMVADRRANTIATSGKYPEKYVAFHHASFNIGRKLNVGVFESVVFSPLDPSKGTARNSFEINYFNPIIFYRAIEQQYGSSDNAILGADVKWNLLRGVSLYGQFVLDEFLLEYVRARTGWWANKFALQGGVKYVDVAGISNLDFQVEANVVRPYTYSHYTSYANYSNYRQSIAHPLGSNFRELLAIVRYQPIGRLNLKARINYYEVGRDVIGDANYGGDILKINTTRFQEFGNETGQGDQVQAMVASFIASYMLKHNFFIDLSAMARKTKLLPYQAVQPETTNETLIGTLSVRWNIAPRSYDF